MKASKVPRGSYLIVERTQSTILLLEIITPGIIVKTREDRQEYSETSPLERDLLKMIGTAALQKTVVLPNQADPIGEQIAKHEMELARLKRTIAKLIIEFGESD